jgi:octaprenyl-diphosphate synthase
LPPEPTLARLLTPEDIKARVYPLAERADAALRDNLASRVEHVNQVGSYVIFSGGKRLRPALFLLAARALGGDGDARLAAIFEYLHAATLLHDDVVDEAGLRRGRPAARVEYGNDSVILVGDFLFSQAYSLAVQVPEVRFVAALAECTTVMAEGQVLELMHTGDLELSPAGYLEIIRAKTAVLLAAACQMGAIHAGAGPERAAALYDYGLELGLAFQMVDDALDYVGTAHEFGKPVGHDLAEGKITLPFLHVRDTAPEAVRAELLDLARRGPAEPGAVERAKELVAEHGGVEATYAAATAHAVRAQAALSRLGEARPGSDLELLLGLPAYVLERRH